MPDCVCVSDHTQPDDKLAVTHLGCLSTACVSCDYRIPQMGSRWVVLVVAAVLILAYPCSDLPPQGRGSITFHVMLLLLSNWQFLHILRSRENAGVQGARGGDSVTVGLLSLVQVRSEIWRRATDQQNELKCVPTIIAHMMGSVRLGFKGLLYGLMGCSQPGYMNRAR
eukprot:1195748-Prorocentrum_minimum.AAC.6